MLSAFAHPENEEEKLRVEREFAPACTPSRLEHLDLFCPICEDELIFVSEGSDGTTAHFRHKVEPDHQRISEGRAHRKAKMKFYEELSSEEDDDGVYTDWTKHVSSVELEKVIRPEVDESFSKQLFGRMYEIADLFFEYKDEKCVVEFQCSSQGWRQFKLRTMYYNLHGYKVLWVLDKNLLSRDKQGRYICSSAFYNLSKMYDGRLYVFDSDRNKLFAGSFEDFDAKTRAQKFSVNWVDNLTDFRFDIGGLGDTFRFADGFSYSDLKNGADFEEWGLSSNEAEQEKDLVCPYCGKEYEFKSYYKKHVQECYE